MPKFPKEKDLKEIRKKLDAAPASRPLAKNASAIEKVKHSICEKFVIYYNESQLTQRALAEKIGIDEALMSKILHYNIDEFTTDRLIKYLSKLYPRLKVDIVVA